MDIHSLVLRSRKLRADIDEMERMSPHDRMVTQAQTFSEVKTVLRDLEHFSEGTHNQYVWLLQQVWDICGTLTRDSTGHAWKRDLPDKPAATEFYQKILALVRWLKIAN